MSRFKELNVRKCCKSTTKEHAANCRHFRAEVKKSDFTVIPSLAVSAAIVRAKIEDDKAEKRRRQREYAEAKKAAVQS